MYILFDGDCTEIISVVENEELAVQVMVDDLVDFCRKENLDVNLKPIKRTQSKDKSVTTYTFSFRELDEEMHYTLKEIEMNKRVNLRF